MTQPTDRELRAAEFAELFEQLPGPRKVDRIRQCQKAMQLSQEKYVRKYIMTQPERVPSWQGLAMLRAALARLKAGAGVG